MDMILSLQKLSFSDGDEARMDSTRSNYCSSASAALCTSGVGTTITVV